MKLFRQILTLNLFLVIGLGGIASARESLVKCISTYEEARWLPGRIGNELRYANLSGENKLITLYFGDDREIAEKADYFSEDSIAVYWIKDPSILPEEFRREFYRPDHPFVILSSETKAPAVWMSNEHAQFGDQIWAAHLHAFAHSSFVIYVPDLPRKRPCLCGDHE